jgi:hypothetical protein
MGGLPPVRPVRWSLAGKLSVALLSILFCTLAVVAYFGYSKFESVYSAMVQSRYSFVAFSIKKRVEDSLNLGFPLRHTRQVQEIVEWEKARDPRILAIEVYDSKGEVLFDTDRGAIGLTVPAALRDAARAGAAQPFGAVDDDALVVGLPLVDSFGRVEGGVVLRYPAAYVSQGSSEIGAMLIRTVLTVFALFAGLGVAGLYLLFARVGARLTRLEQDLAAALDPARPPPDPTDVASSDPFDAQFAEFAAKTREAVDHVRDATDEVGRLDRLA